MDAEQMQVWLRYGTLVVVAVVFAVLWWRARTSGKALQPFELVERANLLARDLVSASEQLWATGKLPREQRYDWAANELKRVAPGLEQEQVIAAVEAAVYWLKASAERLPQAAAPKKPGASA